MEKIPQINHIEIQKKQFQEKLQNILNTQVTTENINNFADKALDNLINLNDEILESYPENKTKLEGKELEDKAYDFYEMEGIENLLDRIQEKSEQIDDIKNFIKEKTKEDPKVFVPADKRNAFNKTTGDIPYEEKKIIPRLTTLLYLLETDFEISKEEITVTEGQVLNSQVRREPYFRVEIDELEKLVYICIEEGNVTYIFDNNKLKEYKIEIDDLDIKTKEERKTLLLSKENIGTKIIQSKNWREKISNLLATENLTYKEETSSKTNKSFTDLISNEKIPQVSNIEFDNWRGFWTDEKGRHWGATIQISKKLGPSRGFIDKNIQENNLQDIKLKSTRKAYCYEKVVNLSEIQKWIKTPKVESQKGEWYNFYTDEEKKHWSVLSTLSEKLEIPYVSIKRYIKKYSELKEKEIKDIGNHIYTAYCYETFLNLPEVQNYLESHEVSHNDNPETNEWDNFYIDENGKHWASKRELNKIFNYYIPEEYFFSLETINIRNKKNKVGPAYCYEKLLTMVQQRNTPGLKTDKKAGGKPFVYQNHDQNNQKIRKQSKDIPLLNTVDNFEKNEWVDFYTDGNGKHWSHQKKLSEKLNVSYNVIKEIKKKYNSKALISQNGQTIEAYCYEDIYNDPLVQDRLKIKNLVLPEEINDINDFYADEAGKHWQSIDNIAPYIKLNKNFIRKALRENEIKLKKIKIKKGQNKKYFHLYSYEDIINIPIIKELLELPLVASKDISEKNEWKGFYTDEKGKHWGTIKKISARINLNEFTIRKYIKRYSPQSKNVRTKNNQKGKSYCYETIINFKEIKRLINTESALNKKEDNWKYYYIDKNGNHWGTVSLLATNIDTSTSKLNNFIKKHPDLITSKKLRDSNGTIRNYYSYEKLIDTPIFKEYLHSNKVAAKDIPEENTWKGFHTDENGNHWGSIYKITQKLNLNQYQGERLIKKSIQKKNLRDLSSTKITGYMYEEIENIIKNENINIPIVSQEKDSFWYGFYTDENNKHWGALSKIFQNAKKQKIPLKRKKDIQLFLRKKNIRNTKNRKINAYCYEEVIAFMKQKKE